VRRHGYEVVIPTDDATLERIGTLALPAPTVPRVDESWRRITDKRALLEICAAADVSYPRTFTPRAEEDDASVVEAARLPVVVKSPRSAALLDGSVVAHSGAFITSDAAAAHAAIRALRSRGLEPLVQERIRRSDKVNLTIFRRAGSSEMRFVYRVLRDVPLTGGIAMALETMDPTSPDGAEAVAALERVCDAAGYEGVANGEFCRSADNGKLYLIEVNARLWGSTWFAERLAQRVVERGVRLALGHDPLPEASYPVGRRFHHLPGEIEWLRLQPRRAAGVAALARTVRPWDVFEYQDASDLAAIGRYALLKARRRLGR
jgi:predicted ATP-grasp superfamily ATP-dependent carboligase